MAIYESEPNNTQSSADTLVLGEVIAGQAYGESDYYKITIPEPSAGVLKISMRTQSGTGSFSATTYDAAGSSLGSVTFSLTEAATWYAIVDKLPAGTYYVRIDDYYSTQATYELKVDSSVLSTVRENEPNNSNQDADRLTLGQSFSAALTTNDDLSDYFKFSIGSAQVLSLDLLTPTANKATYFYEITDAKSNRLGSGSTISEASLSFNAASAGDYFLRVYGNAGTVFQGDYSVKVSSKTGPQTYEIASNQTAVNEGSTATFTVSTTNVASGTSLAYILSGVSASDLTGGSLSGTTTVGPNSQATISVPIAADQTTEGNEMLAVTVQGKTVSTTIVDTSTAPAPPTYSLSANQSSFNEGSTATFTISTTNVTGGTAVPYTLSGVTAADVVGGSLSGIAVIASNGQATISVPIAADQTTEGTETLTVTVQGKTASTQILDTSLTAAGTYAINAKTNSVNEGSTAEFTVTTTNVAAGTSLNYTLSGVSASDIVGGLLSGSTTVASNGIATITVPIASDQTTEGSETLTVTVVDKSASVLINDTSLSPPPTYQVTAASSSVDEGSIAVFNLETTNVTAGTSLSYMLSGVSASDVVGGSLTGTTVVGANGKASISIPMAADLTTEGAETLTLSLQGKSASLAINDTSKSLLQLDTTAPTLSSFSPPDGSLTVAVNSNLAITFSELISRGTGSITLKTAAGATLESFGPTSNRTTVSGSTLTIDPTKPLDIYSRYVLEMGAGAVLDQAGNPSAANSQYDFRAETPDELYHFFVVAFGAAPGVTYMGQLAEATNAGLSLQDIVEVFTTKSQFTSVYPTTLTNKELAARLVDNVVKLSASDAAKQSAATEIEAALGLGWSRGKVIYTVFGNLAKMPLTDPLYGGTAKQFQNQLAVARYFTETLEVDSTSVGRLQAVLGNVTKDSDVSSTARIAQLLAQPSFVVSADRTAVNEGSGVAFRVDSYGVAAGGSVSYLLSGTNVTGADVVGGLLSGSLTLDSSGSGVITVQLAEDKSTEGNETLHLSIQGSTVKTLSVLDTSIQAAPTDTLAPTLIGFDPLPGASNVALGVDLTFTFNEAIKRGSGAIRILDVRGAVVESFEAASSSQLTWQGSRLIINPYGDLPPSQTFRIDIAPGAVKDSAGNDYVGSNLYTITTVGVEDQSGGGGGGGGGGG